MSPLRRTCLEGEYVPTDTDGKQEKEDTKPKRIDNKEDAIEQSDPHHGDGYHFGTKRDSFVLAKATDIGAQCGMSHEPAVKPVRPMKITGG